MPEIDKVIALNIDVDDWDKYIGYMASDYRDIWINHYDFEERYENVGLDELFNTNDEYKEARDLLLNGTIDYIALRCDID